jgi:hypothetical protein
LAALRETIFFLGLANLERRLLAATATFFRIDCLLEAFQALRQKKILRNVRL